MLLYKKHILFAMLTSDSKTPGQIAMCNSGFNFSNSKRDGKVAFFWYILSPLIVMSFSKKPGQIIVLYHYCGLSRFF